MTAEEAAELLAIFLREETDAPRLDSRKLARCFGKIVADVGVTSSTRRPSAEPTLSTPGHLTENGQNADLTSLQLGPVRIP